jgi:AcrR family transcriptional regulator
MPERSTSTSPETHEATKARLLDAAGSEFAERGFDGATVRAISLKARANVAAVNYHFGDKEHLYLAAVIEAHRCGVPDEPVEPPASTDPSEALRGWVRHMLGRVLALDAQPTWHQELMLREMVRPSHASEAMVREMIRPRFERLRAILGFLEPGADARRLDALCFSVVGQCLFYRTGRGIAARVVGEDRFSALDLDYLTEHIVDFTLRGLGQPPRTRGGARPAGGTP